MSSSATSHRSMARVERRTLNFSTPGPTFPRRRIPAVSMRMSFLSLNSISVSMASRVVPGTSLTIERSNPRMELSNDDVEQVARTGPLNGRDSNRFAQTQTIKLHGILAASGIISFVGCQDHGFLRTAQQIGHLFIGSSDARARIDHKNDDVGFLDGEFGLRTYILHDIARLPIESHLSNRNTGTKFKPTRVDKRKFASIPVRIAIKAIARRPRQIFNDGNPLTEHTIKKCRFTDIRSANNSN